MVPRTTDSASPAPAGGDAGGRYRWLVCGLLFLATTINYIDRQILSLLKPILDDKLHWTNQQFGQVNSAFQAAYAVGLLLFGVFVDRFGSRIGYAVSIVAWSVAAIGHAAVGSVGGFTMARVALGARRGGQLSLVNQGRGALVSETGARACHHAVQRRGKCRRDHRPGGRAGSRFQVRLADAVRRHGLLRARLAVALAAPLQRSRVGFGASRPPSSRTWRRIPLPTVPPAASPCRGTRSCAIARPGRSSSPSSSPIRSGGSSSSGCRPTSSRPAGWTSRPAGFTWSASIRSSPCSAWRVAG